MTEPSGSSGANVTTTYTYDVGARLYQVSTTSGATTQNRYFTYDKRGFLTSEQLPEKGSSGNGTVSYDDYDPRGHALRIIDGPNDLTYVYDRAERLTQVSETGGLQRTLKSFTFATANGFNDWKNGKLYQAVANNYYDGTNNLQATETYVYGERSGRVSSRTTVAGIIGGTQGTFTQSFTWNDLGQTASVTYPQLSGVGPSRTVTNTYTNGWLTAVQQGLTNYASSISYHSNGMVNQISRGNGTSDTCAKDANDMRRPASITVKYGITTRWSSGNYAYDGAGDIKAIGSDTYVYDAVSRVKEGKIASVSMKQCYGFDAFGNLNAQSTVAAIFNCSPSSFSVDSGTNRVGSPVTYDSAGSMTAWGSGGLTFGYSWYPTNMLRQYDGSSRSTLYGYTADGERVAWYDSSEGGIHYTLRDLSGEVLREYYENGTWSWKEDYVYRDGLHLATNDATTTKHVHLDHLGTIRLITSSSGTTLATHHYYPFGQEASSTSQDAEE